MYAALFGGLLTFNMAAFLPLLFFKSLKSKDKNCEEKEFTVEIRSIGSDRKLHLAGFFVLTVVTVLSYITHSPLKFLLAVIGIGSCVYAAKKLRDQFDIPLIFIRRNGLNYWGGAFGGLIGGASGLYGSTRNFDQISFAEFSVDISLITIYLVLGCIMFMGAIFQDIEDGYLEV